MIEITEGQREHLRELIAALRSGEYKQGRSRLRSGEFFCCLGVAADLCDSEAWVRTSGISFTWHGDPNYMDQHGRAYFGLVSATPAEHKKIAQGAGSTYKDGSQYKYAQMNDKGASFEEIADAIEQDFNLR